MTTLVVVRAPGLSAAQACRGDLAANLSDLIADGSFAELSGPADPGSLAGARVVDLPFRDMPTFDEELGKVRAGAAGSELVVLSDAVFISQRFFPEIKPGTVLAPADLPRLFSRLLQ